MFTLRQQKSPSVKCDEDLGVPSITLKECRLLRSRNTILPQALKIEHCAILFADEILARTTLVLNPLTNDGLFETIA
jgi:hypothetical protein